jgi:hypothetical protein
LTHLSEGKPFLTDERRADSELLGALRYLLLGSLMLKGRDERRVLSSSLEAGG